MISLTEKDADYICNQIRDEIRQIDLRYNQSISNLDAVMQFGKDYMCDIPDDDIQNEYKQIIKEYYEAKKIIESNAKQQIENWQQIILLLTRGSDE